MKGGTRIAIGVGIGYVLGRTRKMRFALSLAGAAMARRSTGTPAELLERGTALLKSSKELTQLTDTVRGELVGAVRSAAVTAASRRIDALNDRLQQGSTLVSDRDRDRPGEEPDGDAYDRDTSSATADVSGADERFEDDDRPVAGHDEDIGEEHAGAEGAGEEGAGEKEERPAARAPAGKQRAASARTAGSRTAARQSGTAERRSAPPVRRRSRADIADAPVRRTRR